MKMIQIVGYKNSGKTTLAKILINTLLKKGKTVATLKHHGHGGIPLGLNEKDSEIHRRAGAYLTGVEGEGVLQLTCHNGWKLEQIIAIYKLFNIEILIIEGFKTFNFDKIVLIKDEADLHLLDYLTNIKSVITAIPLKHSEFPYPIFMWKELSLFLEWFSKEYLSKPNESSRSYKSD